MKRKLEMAIIKAKNWIQTKKEGSDQLMVMFIIIAVAAGVAGLLYIFAKSTSIKVTTNPTIPIPNASNYIPELHN